MGEDHKQLPVFASYDQLVEFFESHDMGDYSDRLPEVGFDVAVKSRKFFVAIEAELADKLNKIAREGNVSAEELINSWLKEKLAQVG